MPEHQLEIEVGDSNPVFEDVQYLHRTIWGLDDLEITPTHIYRAVQHAGGRILCAYVHGDPVGYVFGFPGRELDGDGYFYSHNLGVLEEWRNQGIAFALKARLREELLQAGYTTVKWTYEPLDSKNAYAYIGKLGGVASTYHREYYGEMDDDINRGLPSDRLVIDWWIDSDRVARRLADSTEKPSLDELDPAGVLNGMENDAHGNPVPKATGVNIQQAMALGVAQIAFEIPTDFHDLKEDAPEIVLQWRLHARDLLEDCFARDLTITDTVYEQNRFFYVLEQLSDPKP